MLGIFGTRVARANEAARGVGNESSAHFVEYKSFMRRAGTDESGT